MTLPNRTIVHDRIVVITGSEKCVGEISRELAISEMYALFGNSKLFHFFHDKGVLEIRRTFMDRIPFITRKYDLFLLLMPYAIESLDLRRYQTVISSSHTVAHGILTSAEQLHISYTYTPVRFAWDLYHEYIHDAGLERGLKGVVAQMILHKLRNWDALAAQRVDHFVAISNQVSRRILKSYGRASTVLWPCVDVERFNWRNSRSDFFLSVGRMVPYKKTLLLVEVFNILHLPLILIGEGPDFHRAKALAGPTVTLLGYQDDMVVNDHLQRCRAFVFAANEDFGIAPVEAMAAGAPVIGFGKGGLLDTVQNGIHGVQFEVQSTDCIVAAVKKFLEFPRDHFHPDVLRLQAEKFSNARFRGRFRKLVEILEEKFQKEGPAGVREAIPEGELT